MGLTWVLSVACSRLRGLKCLAVFGIKNVEGWGCVTWYVMCGAVLSCLVPLTSNAYTAARSVRCMQCVASVAVWTMACRGDQGKQLLLCSGGSVASNADQSELVQLAWMQDGLCCAAGPRIAGMCSNSRF
jgi:hypothetical protein